MTIQLATTYYSYRPTARQSELISNENQYYYMYHYVFIIMQTGWRTTHNLEQHIYIYIIYICCSVVHIVHIAYCYHSVSYYHQLHICSYHEWTNRYSPEQAWVHVFSICYPSFTFLTNLVTKYNE